MWRSATFGVHFSSRPCYRLVVIVSITPAMYMLHQQFSIFMKNNFRQTCTYTRTNLYKWFVTAWSLFLSSKSLGMKKKKWHSTCIRFLIFNLDLQLEEICKKFWTKKRQNGPPMYKLQYMYLMICGLYIIKQTKSSFKLFNCKMHLND